MLKHSSLVGVGIESSAEAHREREAARGREAAAQALEMDAGGEDENKDDL